MFSHSSFRSFFGKSKMEMIKRKMKEDKRNKEVFARDALTKVVENENE